MAEQVLTYCGPWLDRAGGRRNDPEWVAERLASPDATVTPLWRDACLVRDGRPLTLAAGDAPAVLAAGEAVFLGLDGPAAAFAVDLSTREQQDAMDLTGATGTADVRRFVRALAPSEAATLAYARGLLHWHRNQRFCGVCGAATTSRDGGHLRVCGGASCGKLLFPRIEPAVIVLVETAEPPRRCLLGRRRGAAENSYVVLAGFVEIGESLEDAVRREVSEEAGVAVDAVTYQASQAWPFPAGLMVGFRARAASDAVTVDNDELVEARWFTRAQLRRQIADRGSAGLYRVDSIEAALIADWVREAD